MTTTSATDKISTTQSPWRFSIISVPAGGVAYSLADSNSGLTLGMRQDKRSA